LLHSGRTPYLKIGGRTNWRRRLASQYRFPIVIKQRDLNMDLPVRHVERHVNDDSKALRGGSVGLDLAPPSPEHPELVFGGLNGIRQNYRR
jgi:hypothetical protein